MITKHPSLSRPDTILATDCLKQLEQLGVVDKKSQKKIEKRIHDGYATWEANRVFTEINSFITKLFKGKDDEQESVQEEVKEVSVH